MWVITYSIQIYSLQENSEMFLMQRCSWSMYINMHHVPSKWFKTKHISNLFKNQLIYSWRQVNLIYIYSQSYCLSIFILDQDHLQQLALVVKALMVQIS